MLECWCTVVVTDRGRLQSASRITYEFGDWRISSRGVSLNVVFSPSVQLFALLVWGS